MPEIAIGENIDDWMKRCVPASISEGYTYEQAQAMCMRKHEEFQKISNPELRSEGSPLPAPTININIGQFKLETKEIKDVEILHTGKFKGKEYTEKDLDMFIDNFKSKVSEPVLTIDHDESLTKKVANEFKVVALGYVSDLRRMGNKLIADFKQVPKLIAELIEAGPLKQRSIEFFKTFRDAQGKLYNNVLTGVTFFGNGIPAVAGMSDLMNFFKTKIPNGEQSDNVGEYSDEKESINFKSMEDDMDNVTMTKAEYETLLKFKTDAEKIQLKADDLEAQLETFKASEADLKAKLEVANKVVDEFSKFKADTLKSEAEGYIDSQINAKKLLPKFREMKVADYIRFKSDEKALEMFKDEIESRENVIPENYKDKGATPSVTVFKTMEEAQPEYDRLITSGKTHDEAMKLLNL